MESVDERIRLLRTQARRLASSCGGDLNQQAIERILGAHAAKDTFETLENQERPLSENVLWRRRRLGWSDAETGEEQGLCVNEVRVGRAGVGGRVEPRVAMAEPGLVDFDAIEHAYWQTYWAGGAIRAERGRKESRLFLNMRELTCTRLGVPRGPWEDLFALQKSVEEGTDVENQLDVYPMMRPRLRRVDDTPLAVVRYLPAFPPSWAVVGHENVLAATNGGYFLNFPEEYDDSVSALHQPVGALFAGNLLHIPPWIERPCAVEWKDGRRGIEIIGPENIRLRVNGEEPFALERGSEESLCAAVFWRSFDPPPPKPKPDDIVVDLVFAGAGLARVAKAGIWEKPPIGGALVRLAGILAKPWLDWLADPGKTPFPKWELELTTTREAPLQWAIASGPILVRDGRALSGEEQFSRVCGGEFYPEGPPPTRFPYDATGARAPRTAIGLTDREEWVLAVVDGRADMAHSIGCTLEELARLMREIGCQHALNFDGGGSSVLAIEGLGGFDQLRPGLAGTIANIPSDVGHRERIVPVVMTVVH